MDKIYELKEMLCEELEEYGSKDKLDVGGLEIVDKLAHAIKNIDKIIEDSEEGYSGESRRSYAQGGNRGGNRGGGRSNRSYARRNSRGRYSREEGYSMDGEEIVEEIRGLMNSAPDEYTRKELEKLTRKLEA